MQRYTLPAIAAAVAAKALVAATASAAVVGLTNPSFETAGTGGADSIAGWFEAANGQSAQAGREDAGNGVPTPPDGDFWANLSGNLSANDAGSVNTSSIYQQFGTYTPGEGLFDIDFTVGLRGDGGFETPFDGLSVEIWGGGNAAPTSGGRFVDNTGAVELFRTGDVDYFVDESDGVSLTQDISIVADISGNSLTAGDRLWLVFQDVLDPNGTGSRSDELIDDVSIAVVPEPASALALLGGLGLLVVRRRA
jgi:hypothetical protein